jgi:two-component system, NtrC family, nitrogen regulation response regulator NtrX
MARDDAKPIILVVDDEPAILTAVANILQDDGCIVETTSKPEQVLDLIGSLVPDLVFLDIFIPNSNGLDLLATIKKEYPAQKVIIISGYGNIPLAVDALKKGAQDFIEKPFSAEDILNKITVYCGEDSNHPISLLAPHEHQNGLVGESYLFKELIQYTHLIIPHSNHVIIYGPRGIGKTVLATYMHAQKNNNFPYTIINAQHNQSLAIDFKLFDAEGSIIIKHVDALSSDAQKNLLFLLEAPTTKARVFCLTHKPLFSLVTQGLFNEDLFYALNSTPIEIPSLNKRRFDIPLLVHHFLSLINKNRDSNISCSTAALRLLRNHTWSEHCRELKKLLSSIMVGMNIDDTNITPAAIQKFLHESEHGIIEEQQFRSFSSLHEATDSFQKKFLLYQLKKNRYDLDQVCNILSIDVAKLRRELQRLDISPGL